MQWGIRLNVPAIFESDLRALPPPSNERRLSRSDGKTTIEASYQFEFAPQSWREWQRVAAIKVQVMNRLKRCELREWQQPIDTVPDRLYTIKELGQHFPAFVKFPAPQFPQGKKEAYKMLCRHGKRLHFEQRLHLEQLIAVSMRFNEVAGNDEGIRQTMRRAISAYKFALDHCDEWPVKLSADELKHSRRKGAALTNAKRSADKETKKTAALTLKDEGKSDIEICSELGINRSTLWRWMR